MKKKFYTVYIISVLILVWIIASYINVIMHNMDDCKYASWNVFVICLKYARGCV